MNRTATMILSAGMCAALAGCSLDRLVAKQFVNIPHTPAPELTKEQAGYVNSLMWDYTLGDTTSTRKKLDALSSLDQEQLFVLLPIEANYHRKQLNFALAEEYVNRGLALIPAHPDSAWCTSGLLIPNGLVAFMLNDTAGLIEKGRLETGEFTIKPVLHYIRGRDHFSEALRFCPAHMNRAYEKVREHLEQIDDFWLEMADNYTQR